MVNFIVRYFENLEQAIVDSMRPFAWIVAVSACIPLVVGAAVINSGVITNHQEIYYASFGWLAAAAIFPWIVLGFLTVSLAAVNVVVTAVNPESKFRGD